MPMPSATSFWVAPTAQRHRRRTVPIARFVASGGVAQPAPGNRSAKSVQAIATPLATSRRPPPLPVDEARSAGH